jgi:glutamate/aspartate transport system substrate-binding protein
LSAWIHASHEKFSCEDAAISIDHYKHQADHCDSNYKRIEGSMKFALLLMSACALAAAPTIATASPNAAESPILQKIKRGEPIVLGHRTNSPPLSYASESGAEGYSVDICRAAVARLARQVQRREIAITYKPVTLENRLAKIAGGEIDIECGLTTNTTSRARTVNFSPTILVTGTKFVVPANSSVQQPNELSGRVVSAGKGSTNAKSARRFAQERNIALQFRETIDTKAAFVEMMNGKADAAALNEISARGWSREDAKHSVRFLDRYLSTEPVAIALPKHDAAFTSAFNAAVSEVLISGEGEKIYERWLGRFGLGLPINQYTREAHRMPIAFSMPDELL